MARSQATAPCSGSAPKHSASPGTSVTVPEQGTGWPASACPAGRGKAPRGGKARPLAPALPPHGLEGRPCQGHPASGLRAFLAQRPQRTPPFTSERLLRVRTCVGVRGDLGEQAGTSQGPCQQRGAAQGQGERASPERGQQVVQDTPGQSSGRPQGRWTAETSQGRHPPARPGEDTELGGHGGHATQREAGPHLPPSAARGAAGGGHRLARPWGPSRLCRLAGSDLATLMLGFRMYKVG